MLLVIVETLSLYTKQVILVLPLMSSPKHSDIQWDSNNYNKLGIVKKMFNLLITDKKRISNNVRQCSNEMFTRKTNKIGILKKYYK